NHSPRPRKSIRANAYAVTADDATVATTETTATNVEFHTNVQNETPPMPCRAVRELSKEALGENGLTLPRISACGFVELNTIQIAGYSTTRLTATMNAW